MGKTLESIFQTDASPEDFEVIVVNDGTPDGSMDVVRQYNDRPNLTILERENQGLSSARNAGLDRSRGEYVWFVDSDDWLVENGIGKVLKLFDTQDVDVFVFPLLHIKEFCSESRFLDYERSEEMIIKGKEAIKEFLFPLPWSQRYVIRRGLLMSNYWLRFPVGLLHEDTYFNILLMYFAQRVRIMCQPMYIYRSDRIGSMMNSIQAEHSWDKVELYRRLKVFMYKNLDKNDYPWFQARCFESLSFAYYKQLFGCSAFNRFVRYNGLFIWREWLEVHPDTTINDKLRHLFYFRTPSFYSSIMGLFHV